MKPPLALSVVAIAADGSETTWWSGDRFAYNRPQQLSFRTRIGEGFSDMGCTLPRRIDRDYNDLELFNDIVIPGDDGQIAYEGMIGATPRSTQGGHSIAVQGAGWMAHAKQQKFREIYVDRELGQWGPITAARRASHLTFGRSIGEPPGRQPDATNQVFATSLLAPWAKATSEAQYDIGPEARIGSVYYSYTLSNVSTADTNWLWRVAAGNVPETDIDATANLRTVGATGAGTFATTAPRRYATLELAYDVAAGGNAMYEVRWITAVYGNHGVAKRGTAPEGFYASDVISDIAQRFAPKLNTSGVQGTTLVIPHIAFRDRTTPFDAFLLLNGPHGYELAVWEDKTLTFRPYDLSDYDWQVRMDQPGVDVSLQGDTTEGLANYAVVEFDNVLTGQRDQVSPADDSSLEDTTADHPANKHGLDVELTVGLTFPTTKEVAIAFGQSYLGEFNRPKNRGQITVQGHILDRAGHWLQPWLVRAGQTISVTNHPNDAPRLITETSYDHPSRTVTISTDSGELNMVEAVVDYIKTSLQASNLG